MKFKARAECLLDVIVFISAVCPTTASYKPIGKSLDYTVEFESKESLDTLVKAAKNLRDCHVIAQTLKPSKEYTGERVVSMKTIKYEFSPMLREMWKHSSYSVNFTQHCMIWMSSLRKIL